MENNERTKLEYSSLRQEILNSINICDTYKIAMYTVTVAIIAIAFSQKNPILFLLPYTAILAFQQAISKKNENTIVIGAYISVFLERGNGWESENIELKKIMHDNEWDKTSKPKKPSRHNVRLIDKLFGRISSCQLGLLCSTLCLVYALIELWSAKSFIDYVRPSIAIVFAIVLYICIYEQTKKVLILGEKKQQYIANLNNYIMNVKKV